MNDRNIGQEVLEGIREIKAGKGRRHTVQIPGDAKAIRKRIELSQSEPAKSYEVLSVMSFQ